MKIQKFLLLFILAICSCGGSSTIPTDPQIIENTGGDSTSGSSNSGDTTSGTTDTGTSSDSGTGDGSSSSGSTASDTSDASDGSDMSSTSTGSDASSDSTTGDTTSGTSDSGTTDGGTTSGGETTTLPPDPADVAPTLDPTITTTLGVASEFIYTGSNPIQTGVEEGTIDVTRVAVIRGKVFERDGELLSGVKITILNHSEYGSTKTREDGMFDMVVNGGGYLTVVYEKEGYMTVHRKLDTPWMDYVWAEDVAMTPYDTEVSEIDLSGGTTSMQVAQGSESSDEDGTRTATILFPTGTTATMTLEDGTEESLSTLNVRATEYTVGDDGPEAMPVSLPANSAYTYAIEFSVDEAVTAGAKEIKFNKPVYFYVENFLNFPVGEPVPAGYYDKEKSAWVPSDNGVIIKILGDTDDDGLTEIDADGDDLPDDETTLTDLNFTDEERETLTTTYVEGDTLWRVPLEHFSSWDMNWAFGPPDDALFSDQNPFDDIYFLEDDSCEQGGGSVIECQNQTLKEDLPITGTPFSLHYKSSRVPGRVASNMLLNIQMTGDTVSPSLKYVVLELTVAGRIFTATFSNATNQSYEFTWDGLDGYGRKVYGAQDVGVNIGYVYDGIYNSTDRFGYNGNGNITGDTTRLEVTLWQRYGVEIVGLMDQKELGLGGWSISPHHSYDVNGKKIYFGNGDERSSVEAVGEIETFAGAHEEDGPEGDTSSHYLAPSAIDIDAEGSLYIADSDFGVVRKIDPAGSITILAGSSEGMSGYTADGALATTALLNGPDGIAVDKDGNIFFSESVNGLVRKIDTDGILTTIAGMGYSEYDATAESYPENCAYSGDGGLATSAELCLPAGLALDSEGNLFIADLGNHIVRKVDTSGIITTVAGTPEVSGYTGNGDLATSATFYTPFGVVIDRDGNLFISDYDKDVIRKVDTSGIITTIAGTGKFGSTGDGGLATSAKLRSPKGMAFDSSGNLFISVFNAVRKIDSEGIITTVAGTGYSGYSGDGGLAVNAEFNPTDLVLDKNKNLYIADEYNGVIRKVGPFFPGYDASSSFISSEDGMELYHFNSVGQHQSTIDTFTGATLYTFGYDSNNLLATITDEDGNVTTINHDSEGNPTSIVGPYGQTTTFEVDSYGYLKTITNPAGESYVMSYVDQDGLLEAYTNPRGNTSTFDYADYGYLTKDTNPVSVFQTLERIETDDGYQVSMTSGEGVTKSYKVEKDSSSKKTWTNTLPDGTQTVVTFSTSGTQKITTPDGTILSSTKGPDPRFGMQAPLIKDYSLTTPTGLNLTYNLERSVELSDAEDLLTLLTQTDIETINDRIYTSVYDASFNQKTITTPEARTLTGIFDSKGKLLSKQVGTTLEAISYTYDSNGRLSTITIGTTDPRVYILTYYTTTDSSKGLLQSITDPLSQVTSFEYDDAGRVTTETNPDGKIISYTYDENGNVTSVTPPSKPEHLIHYNSLDLVDIYTPPDIGLSTNITQYSYNLDKQLDLITRPDGKTIDLEYDSAGRVSTINADGDTYTYNYNPTKGTLTSISDPSGGSLSFTYDGKLLLTSTLTGDVSGKVGFTYDDNFWVTKETINTTTSYSFDYDDDGLLLTAGALSLTRDPDNGLITDTTLSGVTSSLTYSEIGEIKSEDFSYGGSSIYSTTYTTRDTLGRITEKDVTNSGSTIPYTYIYDSSGRLETATYASSTTSYAYDDNGNRLTKTKDGVTTSATYDDQDRLETYGDNSYTYTDNGELLAKTNTTEGTTTYTYDVLGNLKTVSLTDGTSVDYVIDAQSRRVGKKVDGILTQGFIYKDQLRPIAELDGSNNIVSTFIYASKPNVPDYMVKGSSTYRIISDQLGSPQLIVNVSDGSIVQEIMYDEFGNILSDTNPGFQPFGFAGGIYDQDTKLTRFGARDYDAETGRWTAKDPIGFAGGDSNLYGYVLNDPINGIDPMGLITFHGGFAANFHSGVLNLSGSYGLAVDGHGKIGIFFTLGVGLGVGAELGVGSVFGISSGDCIQDLGGWFTFHNASGGAETVVGLEVFHGLGSHGQPVIGATGFGGIGGGAKIVLEGYSYTWMFPVNK